MITFQKKINIITKPNLVALPIIVSEIKEFILMDRQLAQRYNTHIPLGYRVK